MTLIIGSPHQGSKLASHLSFIIVMIFTSSHWSQWYSAWA